jgi:hypothetical protein
VLRLLSTSYDRINSKFLKKRGLQAEAGIRKKHGWNQRAPGKAERRLDEGEACQLEDLIRVLIQFSPLRD